MQRAGLFGFGWSSFLDESINAYDSKLLRLNLADGRAVYLARPSTSAPYVAVQPLNFYGQIVQNVDNSYTLTLQDAQVHQFNSAGKLVSITDRNNNAITLTYTNGFPTTLTDAAGRTVTIANDGYGAIASLADSTGTIATYTHWFWGILSGVTYADGSQFNFATIFVGNNILIGSVTDALGNVLESHTYDSQGRALTSEVAGNGTEKYTLNYVSATETDVTDALNRVTKYFYDTSKGRNVVTSVEGSCSCGGSQIQTWTYDSHSNVTTKTDALNHTTSYTYDTNGNQLTETNAVGTTTYTYNSFGQVLTVTDPMSGVWTNTYDSHGNLLTAKDALNNTTTLTYDSYGHPLTVTDPRNNVTTLTCDTNGNLTRRTDALSNQTNVAYDARGRVTSVTNALNQVTSYEYDLAGRLKKVIYPDTNLDIGMRLVTLGYIAAHPVDGFDAIVDSIATLGPNKTMEVLGSAGGQVIFHDSLPRVTKMARYGREVEIGPNCRVAPFGNRTGHPTGVVGPIITVVCLTPEDRGKVCRVRVCAGTGPGIKSLQIIHGRIGFRYESISN